jgi:hypothetical protein
MIIYFVYPAFISRQTYPLAPKRVNSTVEIIGYVSGIIIGLNIVRLLLLRQSEMSKMKNKLANFNN